MLEKNSENAYFILNALPNEPPFLCVFIARQTSEA
jgi:hypothetical protein